MAGAEKDYAGWVGRPRKMSREQVSMAVQLYFSEGMPVREVADAIRVSHMTVWRALSRVSASEAMGEMQMYDR